jgi:hypothetical protein
MRLLGWLSFRLLYASKNVCILLKTHFKDLMLFEAIL